MGTETARWGVVQLVGHLTVKTEQANAALCFQRVILDYVSRGESGFVCVSESSVRGERGVAVFPLAAAPEIYRRSEYTLHRRRRPS